jgi:ERF superfamily
MRQSEAINDLAKALSQAQGEVENASKDGKNPHFNSKYASLSAAWNAIREPFTKYGLSIVQITGMDSGQLILTTRLIHASGQFLEGDYPINPIKSDPQGLGSAITYARRYTLMAVAGIAPEDDDGNEGSGLNGSRQAAEEVRDRKLQQIRREEPPTVDENLSDSERFNQQIKQASLNQVNVVLTNLVQMEMPKYFKAEDAKAETDRIIKRFNAAKSSDLDLEQKREVAKLLFQSIKAKREFAQPETEEDITPDALLVLWEEMTDIASTVKVFGRLKEELEALIGADDAEKVYRDAVRRQGVERSNLFKGDKTKGARPALQEIWAAIQAAKRTSITDADIPR